MLSYFLKQIVYTKDMKHLLIIDGKYLAYVALYTRQGLMLNGQPIGAVFGFFSDLLSDLKRFSPTHVHVAWDERTENLYRTEIYPEYKQRESTPEQIRTIKVEDFYGQIAIIGQMLSKIPISQSLLPGLEADDVIALLCRRFDGKVTIHSGDQDLYQLLSSNVSMYSRKKKTTLVDFKNTWKCSPSQWSLVKALAGCPGDNVVGVKGIGEKTAIKIITGNHKKKSLSDYDEVVNKNLKLVKLPFPLVSYRTIEMNSSIVQDIDWDQVKKLFLEKQFYSLLDSIKELSKLQTP